jgi:hypothetical protein
MIDANLLGFTIVHFNIDITGLRLKYLYDELVKIK